MLWEAKLVTFPSLRRGALLAQLAAYRKSQATDSAFPLQEAREHPTPTGTQGDESPPSRSFHPCTLNQSEPPAHLHLPVCLSWFLTTACCCASKGSKLCVWKLGA
jgi:hypothetical protein